MSGQQIGQVVGAAVGVLLAPSTAGASLLWAANGMAIGGAIGGLLMPDQVGLQDQAGPRLNDLKVSSTTYGASITRVFGAYRIGGNLIWALPIQETKHVEEQEVGKGGGSESYDVITYTYSVSFAIALCEGPIDGVRRIWADSALVYDFGTDASSNTLEASSQFNEFFTLYKGGPDQPIDWLIQAHESDTPAYRNVAYIVFNNLQLEAYGDRIPNITVEVVKSGSTGSYIQMESDLYTSASRYLSPIQDKRFFQYLAVDNGAITWYYSNGQDGTSSIGGHMVGSCYYNRDDGKSNIYYTGAWVDNQILKFSFKGKNVKNAVKYDFKNTYYFIWRDKLKYDAGDPYPYYLAYDIPANKNKANGDYLQTYNYDYEAYGTATLFGAWSDRPDVRIRYNGSTVTKTINVTGIGDWHYSRTPPVAQWPTSELHLVMEDCVPFGVPYSEYGSLGVYKILVYKKILYTFFTAPRNGHLIWIPAIWEKSATVDKSSREEIISWSLDSALDCYINDDKIYILSYQSNISSDLVIQVYSLGGFYIETINLYQYLVDFGLTYNRRTFSNAYSYREYFQLQISDKSIVLIINANSKYQLFKLSGNTTVVGSSYTPEKIGEFPLVSVPANYIYSVTYSRFLQETSFYNEDLNTLQMKWVWDEVKIYFDVIGSSTVSLSSIVTELLLSSGIEQINIDTTDGLSVEVEGFVIENVSNARSAIATLQSIYLFDLVEENFIIKLKLRKNSTVVANIEEDDLILNNSVEIKKQLDTELPKKITVSYANNKRDYLKGTQSTIRIDGNSDHNINHDLPIAFTDGEAKNLVEQLMYSAWAQKTKANFNLPLDVNINISDLVTLNYDGIIYTLRVMSITYEKTEMQCVCIGENLNNYSTFAIAQDTTEGFTDSDVYLAGDSFLSVFNSPTLSNTLLDAFGIHYAASGVDPWKGASIIKSNDLGQTYYSVDAILANIPLGEAYGLASGPTTVWDLTNTLRLRCVNGDKLISLTEAQVLSGENYMIVGSEVIQFKNVTPQANGDYIIDTLLRGRRGTEWAVGAHEAREPFIFLTNDIEFSFSTINIERSYKAVTFGTYPDDAIEIKQTYDGTNLKPFAPVSLELNGDIITWVRRDRYISGYLRTLPNSEQQEKYKVELFELGISVFSFEVDNDTTYTYDSITYPNIDTIQVSQYSDNLMDYGYIAEILV